MAYEGLALMSQEHDIDWAYQNELREQWLKDNPDAKYLGWVSI